VVGRHCATRVQLYHALWHYKRRVRANLKKKLKESRAWLQVQRVLISPHHRRLIFAWSSYCLLKLAV
jgi:hypothetical protein